MQPREQYASDADYLDALRDSFARPAITGLLILFANGTPKEKPGMTHAQLIASGAYDIADAMIAERSKP